MTGFGLPLISSPWATAGVCVNSAQSSPCSCLYFHCMDFSLEKAHFLFLGHVYNEMINSSTGFGGDSKIINCGFKSISYLFLCPKERIWRIPLMHFLLLHKHVTYNHGLPFMDCFTRIPWPWNPEPDVSRMQKLPDTARGRGVLIWWLGSRKPKAVFQDEKMRKGKIDLCALCAQPILATDQTPARGCQIEPTALCMPQLHLTW